LVDVVYVATPHTFHKENSLLSLRAGKAVLCEKPFAINTSEAEEVIKFARDKKLFLMEAMWTRFFPLIKKLRQILTDGVIGELKMITADFGIQRNFDPEHRLFNPELGGGALLDVGIYPVSLASMFLGTPKRITSIANLSETGIDEQSAIILGYDQRQLAVLYTAVIIETPIEMILIGTEGRIRIHSPMYVPTRFTLSLRGKKDEVVEMPLEGNGYNYEAAEVMCCLREGKLESKIMPLDETLSVMKTLDQIRAQWGLRYPME
jgi:dihydrodiol dehydrogenase / D-xylose 1-dehydrogenase (NADP)